MTQAERPVSTRVVTAVAEASGTEPDELPPLQYSIEADALDSIFDHESANSANGTAPTVLFSYAGYEVHVRSASDIEVRESDDGTGP